MENHTTLKDHWKMYKRYAHTQRMCPSLLEDMEGVTGGHEGHVSAL